MMVRLRLCASMLAALAMSPWGSLSASAQAEQTQSRIMIAQIEIQQRVVVRIRPINEEPPTPRIRFTERDGPDCIATNMVAGATISSSDSIDLTLRGGGRMRAKLERSCPSIDFYSGFYVKPSRDGRICHERDKIHSRAGGECGIEKFKSLVPAK